MSTNRLWWCGGPRKRHEFGNKLRISTTSRCWAVRHYSNTDFCCFVVVVALAEAPPIITNLSLSLSLSYILTPSNQTPGKLLPFTFKPSQPAPLEPSHHEVTLHSTTVITQARPPSTSRNFQQLQEPNRQNDCSLAEALIRWRRRAPQEVRKPRNRAGNKEWEEQKKIRRDSPRCGDPGERRSTEAQFVEK